MTTVNVDVFICQSTLQVHCRVNTSDFGATISGETGLQFFFTFWRTQSLPVYGLLNPHVPMAGDVHDSSARTGIPNGRK